jgi:hypothetical protein
MTRYRCIDCMWGPCFVISQANTSPPPRCLWAKPDEEDPPGYFKKVTIHRAHGDDRPGWARP